MEYDKIYNRAKRVYNTFDYLNSQVEAKKITKHEAQEKALFILKHYKYSDDSGYVWVGDYDMNIIFHPHIESGINIEDVDNYYDKVAFKNLVNQALKTKPNSPTIIEHKWKKENVKQDLQIRTCKTILKNNCIL